MHDPLVVFQQKIEPSTYFVERESNSLDSVFTTLTKHRRVAVTGLPGVGKTELCNQIVLKARDVKKSYKAIFWLSAESDASIQLGLLEMARKMNLYNEADVDATKLRESIVNELNREDDWLMVLDNVDDVDVIESILAEQRGNRHLLITTRDHSSCNEIFAEEVHLDVMNKTEARRLLLGSCAPEVTDNDKASELVDELSCLPLAIIQAAAYLRATRDKIKSYTELYRRSRAFIWNWMPRKQRFKDPNGRSYVSVATTMMLAFEKIKHEELSVRLFCLLSFFSSNNIPELLFTDDPGFQDEELRQCF